MGGPFHLRHDRRPGPVGVAVSGGGDSMALLDAAATWAARHAIPLHAATVDHGLRPGAAAEAAAVAAHCAGRGIPHATLPLHLSDGPALQERARDARHAALRAWAREARLHAVLLGHTADDVAESLVMRLARGTGIDGLAAMPEWTPERGRAVPLVRPFLRIARAELRDHLRARGIAWAEDPSNDDPRFERVRARRRIAAMGWDPALLARSAHALAEGAQALDERAHDLAGRHLSIDAGGDVRLPLPTLHALRRDEPETLRRILAATLAWVGDGRPRGDALARVMRDPWTLPARHTLCGCLWALEPGDGPAAATVLRIGREPAACAPPVPLGDPWDGRWHVHPPEGTDPRGLAVGALADDLPSGHPRGDLSRDALLASPAARDADGTLVAAPVAGIGAGWIADLRPSLRDTMRPRRPRFG